jgi:hypothetical protein
LAKDNRELMAEREVLERDDGSAGEEGAKEGQRPTMRIIRAPRHQAWCLNRLYRISGGGVR